ncbi:MAG: hypothetical protein J6K19_07190 [Prevotella sp.]|nr:hypothetical protein [Prevotella sp.]
MSFWINAAIWAIIIGVGMWKCKPRPFTIVFIVSVFVGLETYCYVSDWISYLSIGSHLLFYVIPVAIFLISSFVYCKKTNTEWEYAMSDSNCWYLCVIITVWLSLPTVFIFYDWHHARIEYESEMKELFGEEWEDEVEEMKQEIHI